MKEWLTAEVVREVLQDCIFRANAHLSLVRRSQSPFLVSVATDGGLSFLSLRATKSGTRRTIGS